MYAAASFVAFSDAIAPDRPTGCAAPTFVPGAIAATCAESRMKVPAEAAREPAGETKAITGRRAFRIACVISRIEESSPPGVSIVSRTAVAPSSWARSISRVMWSATKGSTTPSSGISTMAPARASCCAPAGGTRSATSGTTNRANAVTRRMMPTNASSHPRRCSAKRVGRIRGRDAMMNGQAKASSVQAAPRIPGRRYRVAARGDGPLLAREELQLAEGLLAGNEDALRALYARYARPIFTLGLRLLGSPEAAEELTQDVFLAAWRKAARFDPSRGRLSTWLMTIAHNLAVDRLRRETGATRPHLVLVDEVPEIIGADEDEPLMERDAALRALSSLSDAERRLLARAYFGGLTAREIAEDDGIPLGTVKTRLRTALIKVRRANQDKERPL